MCGCVRVCARMRGDIEQTLASGWMCKRRLISIKLRKPAAATFIASLCIHFTATDFGSQPKHKQTLITQRLLFFPSPPPYFNNATLLFFFFCQQYLYFSRESQRYDNKIQISGILPVKSNGSAECYVYIFFKILEMKSSAALWQTFARQSGLAFSSSAHARKKSFQNN